GLLASAVAVLPFVLFQYSAYDTFCRRTAVGLQAAAAPPDREECPAGAGGASDGARGCDAAVEAAAYGWPRPWCSSRVPYVYGFVQAQYWGVGLFRYWTLQQLPNFLLAAPVLLLSAVGLTEYGAANWPRLAALALAPLEQQQPQPPQNTGRADGAGAGCRGEGAAGAAALVPTGTQPPPAGSDSSSGGGGGSGGRGGAPASRGYLSPSLAVFMYPWAFSLAVALAAMHVQ
ncbi:GPI mannosyltransferase 2, partial [Tetrabaena socialis]